MKKEMHYILLIFLIIQGIVAQCPVGKYGDNCLCNSPMQVYDDSAECVGEGEWQLNDDIIINDALNISYDVIRGSRVELQAIGSVTIQFETLDNNKMRNGRFDLTSEFIFDGKIKFLMENLTYTGNFSVNLIKASNAIKPENPVEIEINKNFRHCRDVILHSSDKADYQALKLEVIETEDCDYELANADWVLYVYIAICILAVLVIVFALVTCFVRPLKKMTWYPSV